MKLSTLWKAAAAKEPISDVPSAWRYLEVVQAGRLRPGQQNQRGALLPIWGSFSGSRFGLSKCKSRAVLAMDVDSVFIVECLKGPRTRQPAADRLWLLIRQVLGATVGSLGAGLGGCCFGCCTGVLGAQVGCLGAVREVWCHGWNCFDYDTDMC